MRLARLLAIVRFLRARSAWLAALVAVGGIGFSVASVVRFLLTLRGNGLPWQTDDGIRELYLAVGNSYSQGFTAGFFLSFFMTVGAILVSAAVERRRRAGRGTARRRPPGPHGVLQGTAAGEGGL